MNPSLRQAVKTAFSRCNSLIRAQEFARPLCCFTTASATFSTLNVTRTPWSSPKCLEISDAFFFHGRKQSFSAAAASLPAFDELPMPSLSPTMTQGNVAEWKKAEGDKISPGDVLADIETDKATMEMESMEEGYLAKILSPAGSQNVEVGTPVAIIVQDAADVAAFANYTPSAKAAAPAAPQPTAPAAPTAPAPVASKPAPVAAQKPVGARIFVSPLAKKLAAEYGISLSGVTGTGPSGRIIKADVEYAKLNPPATVAAPAAAAAYPTWMFPDYTDMPVKMIQKVTAQRLT